MRLSLSTNWCNRRMESGEEIADKAIELGFSELELGFHTTMQQIAGFKSRLDRIPVGSVHAFCPVPISAPQGYPELYQLADVDDEGRAMARLQVLRNIKFAADMGADSVVLHAGRVMCRGFLRRFDLRRRVRRGKARIDVFRRELDGLVPELEKFKVRLGLENLPYMEGFPAEWEMEAVCGDWVQPWFDTGHDFVIKASRKRALGMHLNDSVGGDDHLVPGSGKVDFKSLTELAKSSRHLVFEPNASVTESELREGLSYIRKLWEFTS